MVDSFLIPALECAKEYKRTAGFFSSSAFEVIKPGVIRLARNGGRIQLITSPNLREEDISAIQAGYTSRQSEIERICTAEFEKTIDDFSDTNLQLLFELIKTRVLDIRIAVTKNYGMYHDKLGILSDFENNTVVFYGSSNASLSGYKLNYEKIRLAKSWDQGFEEIVENEVDEFDQLWNNTNPDVEVFTYNETAKANLIKKIESRKSGGGCGSNDFHLRDYQEDAIDKWVNNGYCGFYVMATGTGKTWTAIYSAAKLIESFPAITVICAPYKHLIKQWAGDVRTAFPKANIIMVSSENAEWKEELTNAVLQSQYDNKIQLIVISTIKSFTTERFEIAMSKYKGNRLLIVDEAHRFTNLDPVIQSRYRFRLGLSATPFSGTSTAKGKELMDYFGGQVCSLPIEEALGKGYLVKYYYHPIYVYSTTTEEEKFSGLTQQIFKCFENGVLTNKDLLVKTIAARLRIISMAEEKLERLPEIIEMIGDHNHFVVYCGDGKLFDDNTGEELRYIQKVKRILADLDIKTSQFTATENMTTRMQLVDLFNKGDISSLVAIRCLDEGINIPSIKTALILSSNDDYREFVQRRGRILRKYPGKEYANIYDVIVLPSSSSQQWAKIELRRYLEYARLAVNWNELQNKLTGLLAEYGLNMDDIDVFDYEDMEVNDDE